MSQPPRRSRGRPRSFDPDKALANAGERFRSGGFAGTSLDDLAEATGLNRPSLYAAFGDKRAMYLAALDRTYARLVRAFDSLDGAGLPLRQSLEAMFRWTIDGYLTGERGPAGCVVVSTAATAAVTDDEVRSRLNAFLALEDERITALLAARSVNDAAPKARLIASVLHSLSTRTRAGASKQELDTIAADCIDLIAPPCD